MLVLLVSAFLILAVVLGGWSILVGGSTFGIFGIIFAVVYILLAVMVFRWSRGALTLSIAFAVLLAIFCAVGAGSWFARDKPGFAEASLPTELLGIIVVLLIPVQMVLAAVAWIAFTQEWHVEEERSLSDGAPPPRDAPGRGESPLETRPAPSA